MFALHQEAAECDYLGGHFVEPKAPLTAARRARTRLDKAKIYALKVLQYEHMSRYAETIRTGREGLTLGLCFPDLPAVSVQADTGDGYACVELRSGGAGTREIEAEQVCQAIAALPEDYCIVSALYFMEEFSYQEIAEMVGCPVGTVRSRLHRGRRMLQRPCGILPNSRASSPTSTLAGIGWRTGRWRCICGTLCPGHLAGSSSIKEAVIAQADCEASCRPRLVSHRSSRPVSGITTALLGLGLITFAIDASNTTLILPQS